MVALAWSAKASAGTFTFAELRAVNIRNIFGQ
jgi:hypothetical protein